MAYKPQTVKTAFGGPKGGAKCVWNKEHTKLQVKLGEETFVFSKSALPMSDFPSGEYYIQLSEDKKEITTIRPNTGMFVVKVDRFVAKEGEKPAPKTNLYEYQGKEVAYQSFSVMLKVVSPKEYADMEILFSPRYNFEGIEDTVKGKKVELVAYNHPKSKYTPLLQDFCDATGVWDKGPMLWDTNILPTLEKRIANADKKFQVVMKDGWVNTIFSMPDMIEDEEEETETKTEQEETFETPEPEELDDSDDELPWNE